MFTHEHDRLHSKEATEDVIKMRDFEVGWFSWVSMWTIQPHEPIKQQASSGRGQIRSQVSHPWQTRTGAPLLAEAGDHTRGPQSGHGGEGGRGRNVALATACKGGGPQAHLHKELNPANNAGKHSSRFCPQASNRNHGPADTSILAWGGPSHTSDLYEKSKCCFDPFNFW